MQLRNKRIIGKDIASTSKSDIASTSKSDLHDTVNKDEDAKTDIQRIVKEEDTKSEIHHIVNKAEDVDDFYFSALYDEGEVFPISDEKYAQQLQLQETLIFSASKTYESSSSQNVASSPPPSQNSQKDASTLPIPESSTPLNKLKRKQPMVKSEEEEEAKVAKSFCGICMDTKFRSEMFSNAKVCGHLFCSDCIREHVSVKIKENMAMVKCPDPTCRGVIGPELCRSIVPKEVLERWEDALCESLILGTQKFYCPFKDCSAMLVDDSGQAVTSSECPNCNRLFCAQCKVAWHSGLDCTEYKSLKEYERNPEDLMLMELAKNKKWKRCPKCKFYVEKRDGCDHISCRCGRSFSYLSGN